MSKKVLFLSSSSCGGAERMTVLYAKILQKAGFLCSVLIYKNKRRKDAPIIDFVNGVLDYQVIECRDSLLSFHLYKILRNEHDSIVFCSQPVNSLKLLRLKKYKLIDVKIVFRDFLMPSNRLSKPRWKEQFYFRLADGIIAQTAEMKLEMLQYYNLLEQQVTVIHNPLDKDLIHKSILEESELSRDYINFVAVNRIDKQKDIPTLLKAFASVHGSLDKCRLYVCGRPINDSYLSQMTEICKTLNIEDSVFFVGQQSNPFKFVNDCNVFVLSSLYEGLPNAMLEAMYLGKPVAVTHSIPFIRQIVKNGVNGYSVDVGDYEALSNAMIKAIEIVNLQKFVDICNSDRQIIDYFKNI